MLRIIAGKYRSLRLELTNNSEVTRPTMDKVREAVFSILGSNIYCSVFLDLFSGTGAIAFEALSRGAEKVYINEIDKNSFNVIKKNSYKFNKEDQTKLNLNNLDYQAMIDKCKKNNVVFDIVYLDPPYKMEVNRDIICKLNKLNMLANSSIIFSESLNEGLDIVGFEKKVYKYGTKFVTKYTKINSERSN